MIKGMDHPIVREDLRDISRDLGQLSRKFEGKTILVTGGAGFLGKYIVLTLNYLNEHVLKEPCKIIVLDNFIVGLRNSIEESENVKVIEQDISVPFKIDGEIDYIMHAASIAAPVFYNKLRMETIDVGYLGTKNMLDIAREKKVKSFLYFSSSEVYGNPDPKFVPTPESYLGNVSCFGPRAVYDEGKRIGETLCVTYADLFNVPTKIVRLFNVFGPGMRLDDGRGVINSVVSAIKGQRILVYGDGKNTRTWTYVSDATIGFFKVLLSETNSNKEIYNVGSDEQEIEMNHLARLIAGLVDNKDAEVHNVEGPNETYTKADPNRRCPDLTKIRTTLGYAPKITLSLGLKRLIEWVRDTIKAQETHFGIQTKCRICENQNLKKAISLGKTPLANNLLSEQDKDKEEVYPLEINYCPNCHLCQLSYVVEPEKMFKNYLYVSSTTETFRKHFAEMADKLTSRLNLQNGSLVVDIGSNDGLLLQKFKDKGIRVVGVEPADNVCEIARNNGIDTLNEFFDEEAVKDIVKMKGKADLITANNVFAHINDIKSVVKNVKNLLKDNGVFVIEVQYILDTIQKMTFDNIYHEHLSYYSVIALNEFFNRNGMKIFNVERVDTHGGSIRVYVQKTNGRYFQDSSVNEFINKEKLFGMEKFETYSKFAEKIQNIGRNAVEFVAKAKREGKKIVGYGAPAKATTFLNFCGINNDYIDFIVEDNPLKQGMVVPGVKIPIKAKAELERANADYIAVLAWNFANEIMEKNEIQRRKGSKFVVLFPEVKVL